jgi:glutamate-1-semialdehyde 2,1-aminomutase
VVKAVVERIEGGLIYAAQHEGEAELAARIVEMVPSADMVAFSTSGSEAVHTALRIARATTGRRIVVKFEGHYHGTIDNIFVSGPGTTALGERSYGVGVPGVAGEPPPRDVVVTHWLNLDALAATLDAHSEDVAAVIMEPVPAYGCLVPEVDYLRGVQDLCARHGALLIFDEVVSGFRLAAGGAQELLGVTPDMTVLGKAIASGLPASAVAGTHEAMTSATTGEVHHAGTYNGNPLSVAAALATLDEIHIRGDELYAHLERLGSRLQRGFELAASDTNAPVVVNRAGSIFQLSWGLERRPRTYRDVCTSDADRLAELSHRVLRKGIYTFARGGLLLSASHSEADIDKIVSAHAEAFAEMVVEA